MRNFGFAQDSFDLPAGMGIARRVYEPEVCGHHNKFVLAPLGDFCRGIKGRPPGSSSLIFSPQIQPNPSTPPLP